MGDPKPIASLSSGLLARKGGAKPAMRRQINFGSAATAVQHDDLGWNDMGYDVDPDQTSAAATAHAADATRAILSPMAAPSAKAAPAVQPAIPEVVHQQDKLARAVAAVAPPRAARRQRAGANGRYAFTLRIDPERHMKLRLASALQNVSAQNMLTEALDRLLEGLPGLEQLAAQAKAGLK